MEKTNEATPTSETLLTRLEELRVKAHLMGMDAHDQFETLRHEIKALGGKVSRGTKKAARELLQRIQALEASVVVPD